MSVAKEMQLLFRAAGGCDMLILGYSTIMVVRSL